MIFKDYYRILEFKTNKVSVDQIKLAYRELAKKYHPDVNLGNEKAEERFKDINEAYRVLTDTNGRKKYDRMWNSNIGNKRPNKMYDQLDQDTVTSDVFTMLFGNLKDKKQEKEEVKKQKKAPVKGDNIETEINISIKDAFYGAEKKVSLRTVDGKMKTFSIKVPAGIRDKEKIRLLGQGKAGQNGGKNGDLFIKIKIEDNEKYKLNGYDLITNLYLSPWEAALGARVNIQGIDDKVALYIPPGIQSGERVRIAKKGYKDGKGDRGDLIAEIKIMVPKELAEQEKELFEKLSEISNFMPR